MKNGKCPKCNSTQVYKKRTWGHRSYIVTSVFRFAKLTDYVCTDCGFTEAYIFDQDKLNDIKNKWEKV